MESDYRVRFYEDDLYEVYDLNNEERYSEYMGRLADCESWIRLKEDGKI